MSETVALVISILILLGIAWIFLIFQLNKNSSEAMHQIQNPLAGFGRKVTILSVKVIACLLVLGLLPGSMLGQWLRFDRLSLEEGLSQSSVLAMVQDRQGFLWIGTEDGLNRYDGYGFKVYRNDPTDSTSLGDNYVRSLYADDTGVLWVGTREGGLNRFDPSTGRFTSYKHDPSDSHSLSHNYVRLLYADRAGVLWVGTGGGGLNRFDPSAGRFTRYQHNPDDPHSLSDNQVWSVYADDAGVFWVGTYGGLNRFDPSTGRFTRYQHDPDDPNSLSNNNVRSLYGDGAGVLWVSTSGGLNRFDASTGRFTRYEHDPSDPHSLSSNTVSSLYGDRAGVLWVGTSGGLNRFDASTGRFTRYEHDPSDHYSLSDNFVTWLYEDHAGVLWVGTLAGGLNRFDTSTDRFTRYRYDPADPHSLSDKQVWSLYEDGADVLWVGTSVGLNRFDPSTGRFTHYRHDPDDPYSLSQNQILSLYEDGAGMLWVGTLEGGLNRFDASTDRFTRYRHDPADPHSLSDKQVWSLYEDGAGVLWVGTREGGLNRFDPSTGRFTRYEHDPDDPHSLSHNFILSIYEDGAGMLWVGTGGGGLNHFDPSTGRFTRYEHDPSDSTSLSDNRVWSLYEDRAGTLWVGTGGGLNKFDPATETFRHSRQQDSLPNDAIYNILEDNQHHLWLSTNLGLSRFNPQTETFLNYDVTYGLQSNQYNARASFKSQSGQLYFGGIGGLTAFYPDSLETNLHVPPVVLTSFKKYNREVQLDRPITALAALELSYTDDVITFEFAALDFRAPQKNQYAYKLEGFDEEWIELGTKHDITFTDLDPGSYTLRVKGSNNDGIWNEAGLSLAIHVVPPFWQTWWFRFFSLTTLVGLIVAGHRLRTRRIETYNRQLRHEIEQKQKEMEVLMECMVRQEKLATIGKVSGSIAHELRNPLGAIKQSVFFLKRIYDRKTMTFDEPKVREHLDLIADEIETSGKVISDLLQMTRMQSINKVETSLAEIVSNAQKRSLLNGNQLDIVLKPESFLGWADPLQLCQVFTNLFNNSAQAISENGKVTVRAEYLNGGEQCLIEVRDDGKGIVPEEVEQVFEPLFTTKAKGTGLGLSVCKQIIESHEGSIRLTSKAGKGTVVEITLPCANQALGY